MTQKVIPSVRGDSNAYVVAQLIAHGAGTSGWIQPSDEVLVAHTVNEFNSQDIPFNAFRRVQTDGLNIQIDSGEAIVGGAWLAKDDPTWVSVPDNTVTSVYLGWAYDATDTVLIGAPGAFDPNDLKIPLFDVETEAGEIASLDDVRRIGRGGDQGRVSLGAGSTIDSFLATGRATQAHGTPDEDNEIFRAPGSVSDLVLTVQDGGGRMNLCWNAYFDGEWRYIVGDEAAMRLTMGAGTNQDDVSLFVAGPGTADDRIVWSDALRVDASDGWLDQHGRAVYDGDAVPQARQGGPAGSLSAYPIPADDIADGRGSGLDADTVDGLEASELGSGGGAGAWAHVDTLEDADASSPYDFSWTTADPYDQYRVRILFEDHSTDRSEVNLRLNGDGTSSYDHMQFDLENEGIHTQFNQTAFEAITGTLQGDAYSSATIDITCPTNPVNATPVRQPQVGLRSAGSQTMFRRQFQSGVLTNTYDAVDEFRLWSHYDGTGKIEIFGRDF